MTQAPFFHAESGAVRFWIEVEGISVGASVTGQTLHYHFRPTAQGEDPLETYRTYAKDIEAAVRRRVAQGSIEPVMLREFDLRASATPAPER